MSVPVGVIAPPVVLTTYPASAVNFVQGQTAVILTPPMHGGYGYGPYGQGHTNYMGYMRRGVQIGGMAISLPLLLCPVIFGAMFIFSGTMAMATSNNDPEFWSHFDRTHSPALTAGAIIFTAGCILMVIGICLCCFGYKKYKQFRVDNPGMFGSNPGQVYDNRQNPGQPQFNQQQQPQYIRGQVLPGQNTSQFQFQNQQNYVSQVLPGGSSQPNQIGFASTNVPQHSIDTKPTSLTPINDAPPSYNPKWSTDGPNIKSASPLLN